MPIVDRGPEMEQIEAALESAKVGVPSLVLILGDSGTGKSFLADNFLRDAEAKNPDLVVACGSGQPLAGHATSLQPIREILEFLTGFSESKSSAVRSTQDNQRLGGVRKALLSALISDPNETLAPVLARPTFEQLNEAQVDQNRIKALMSRAIASSRPDRVDSLHVIQRAIAKLLMAADCTLAIVLDDIQWVDPASLQLFLALQRELQGHRTILLATARTDDEMAVSLPGDFTIEQLKSSIVRNPQNVLIDLNDVRRARGRIFCAELLKVTGFDPSDENVNQFLQLTGANALFARDVLEPLAKSAPTLSDQESKARLELISINWDGLPKNHSDTMERRIQLLSQDAAAMLEIAAVEGQEFTAEVIAEIKGMDFLRVLEILEVELSREHRLIEDISSDFTGGISARNLSRFKFSHGYYQQFIYDVRIQPARRKELHRRVGLALEKLWHPHTDLVAAPLARHFETAGDKRRTITYYAVAARRNLALADFEAAAFCAKSGLTVARLAATEERPDQLADLYTVGTTAARTRGDFNLAAILAKEGLSSLTTPPPLVAAKLKSELARSLYNLDTGFEESKTLLEEAIVTVSKEGELETEADLYRQLGIVFQRQARFIDALQQYLQGLRIASGIERNLVCADIINSVGVSFGLSGFFEFSVLCHEKALELARKLGDSSRDTLFLNDCAAPLRRLDRLGDALNLTKQSIRLAEEQGKPGALARAKYEQAQVARVEQNWNRYASLLREVLQHAADLGGQSPHLRKALAELVLLSLVDPTDTAMPAPGTEPFGLPGVTGTTEMHSVDFVLGVCALKDGNQAKAIQHFRSVQTYLDECKGGVCWAWPFLRALASYGESACLSGQEKELTQARAGREVARAHHQFGLKGVWRDVSFYGVALTMVSDMSWPDVGLQDGLGATDRPKAVATLESSFRELLDRI